MFVAVEIASGRMVATVRVFRRTLRVNGETIAVGGIGEVSTLPAFRPRPPRPLLAPRARRARGLLGRQAAKLFISELPSVDWSSWTGCVG